MIQTLRNFDSSIGWFLDKGASILFWLSAAAVLIVCLIYQVQAAKFPYQLDYGEAPLVDQAMRLAQGQNIYRADISSTPYTISNYPPLYVALLAISVKLVGPASTFMMGRIISTLSVWLASLCLFLILYSQTHNRLAAATAAVVLLAFPYVVTWSSLMRIDSLALALSMGALAVLVTKPITNKRLILVALLLVAAIFTRQTYALAAPFAAFVWLLSQDWRKAIQLTLLVGGLCILFFFALNIATHGGFYFNIVTANVNEFKMDILKYHWNRTREIAMIPLLFGGLSLFLIRRLNPLWMLAAPYLFASALSALTIGKIGSNVNYLLEFCAALSLAAGIVIAVSQKYLPIRTVRALILIALIFGLGRMIRFTRGDYSNELRNRYTNIEEIKRLSDLVADTPGDMLADEYMGLLTQHGRALSIQPFEVTQLAWAGKWDQTPLLNSIENKEYSAIIIYDQPWAKERWTQEMFDAIDRSYELKDIIAGNKVYMAFQETTTTEITSCSGGVWQIPSSTIMGVEPDRGGLNLFGQGNGGEIPVYAPANGLLTRLPDRVDAVAILQDDPMQPGRMIWVAFEDMADAAGTTSYVAEEFPSGAANVPVKAGQLIGYQGTWSGISKWPKWLHVHFAVIDADGEESFPIEMASAKFLDPAPYLGLMIDVENQYLQVARCK